MIDIPWRPVTMEAYIRSGIGAVLSMTCNKHGHTKHELVGKRTQTEGEQTQLELQWFCHRCAKEMSPVMSKKNAIDMILEVNARAGQLG